MATYYKFGERDKQERIDWGGIAKEFSDDIKKERTRRDELKKDLDKQMVDAESALDQVELTSNKSTNELILEGVQNYKNYIKSKNDDLKRGKISPNEYTLSLQSAKDDWTNAKGVTQSLGKSYQELMESGTAGDLLLAEYMSKNLDLANGKLVPGKDGRMTLQVTDEDGNVTNKPIRTLQKEMNERWDNVKLDQADIVKSLGVEKIPYKDYGSYESAKANPAYKAWLENYTESKLAKGPQQISSILTEFGGYKVTLDKSQAGDNKIYVERDASGKMIPQLTDEMKEKAKEVLKTEIEVRLSGKRVSGKDKETAYDLQKRATGLREREQARKFKTEDEKKEAIVTFAKDIDKSLFNNTEQVLEGRPYKGGTISTENIKFYNSQGKELSEPKRGEAYSIEFEVLKPIKKSSTSGIPNLYSPNDSQNIITPQPEDKFERETVRVPIGNTQGRTQFTFDLAEGNFGNLSEDEYSYISQYSQGKKFKFNSTANSR